MIAPYRHVASLDELSHEELGEHYKMIALSTRILTQAFKPDSFNIGMNLGRIAGAGIDQHIHSHIVPRWAGDTNFMPVLTETRVINEALEETYQKLVGKF
jgi:ATP adenylyltransferase